MPIPTVTAALLLFAVVVIHECSHACVAKLLGFPLERICIGIPLEFTYTIRGKRRRVRPCFLGGFSFRGIRIEFSWLLLGGGVVISNTDYAKAAFWKKVLVVLYGPLANIVCGVISAMLVLGVTQGWAVTNEFIRASVEAVHQVGNGTVPIEHLTSPVGAVTTMADVIKVDYVQGTLLCWLLLNFSVAIVNLVPLPALDGGQVFMAALSTFGKKGEQLAFFLTRWTYRFLLSGILILAVRDVVRTFG